MRVKIKEGDLVRINPDTYLKKNRKRAKWVEEHLGEIFEVKTKQQSVLPQIGEIYILVDDDIENPWYFQDFELIKMNLKVR